MSTTRGYTGVQAAVKFKRGLRPKHNVAYGVLGELHLQHNILLRWRSSLWKLTGAQLIVYTIAYLAVSLLYRLGLTTEQAIVMDKLILWMRHNSASLPLTFLLGFYVSLVVKRWWEQYVKLPWPDDVASYLKIAVDEEPRKENTDKQEGDKNKKIMLTVSNKDIRLTVMRYLMVSYILCLRRISTRVRKTYPDIQSIVEFGLLRKDEADRIGEEDEEDVQRHGGSNWWLPIKWSIDIIKKARKEGRFANPPSYAGLVGKVCDFRKGLTQVASYGHVPIPLVYTQVVHLAVYIHFAVRLVGDQWLDCTRNMEKCEGLDLYYPIFLTIKFLFFFGWLNVAQTLYNPFGCDDDDFEVCDLINRHLKIAATVVDEGDNFPDVRSDEFWKSIPHADEGSELIDEKKNGIPTDDGMKPMEQFVVDEIKEGMTRKMSFMTKTETRDMGQ